MRNDLDRRIDRRVDYSIEESAAVLLIRPVDFNWHLCQFFFRTFTVPVSGKFLGMAMPAPYLRLHSTSPVKDFFVIQKNLRWTWVAFFCTTSRILDF